MDGATLTQYVFNATDTLISRLNKTWKSTLDSALALLKELHVHESSSKQWRQVSPGRDGTAPEDVPESVQLAVARRRIRSVDVFRATWVGPNGIDSDVDPDIQSGANGAGADAQAGADIGSLLALLSSQELLAEWFPQIESSEVLETLGLNTCLCKTRFKLGWPASPRDAVLLTHTVHDHVRVLHVATSVPRASDAPSYLRPSPPYVRAHVHILALFAQKVSLDRTAVTAYWAVDARGSVLGVRPNAMTSSFPRLLPAYVQTAKRIGTQIPYVAGYGRGIEITSLRATPALRLEYSVMDDDELPPHSEFFSDAHREATPRSIRICLSTQHSWDVNIQAESTGNVHAKFTYTLERVDDKWNELCIRHAELEDPNAVVRTLLESKKSDDTMRRSVGSEADSETSEATNISVKDAAASTTVIVNGSAVRAISREAGSSHTAIMPNKFLEQLAQADLKSPSLSTASELGHRSSVLSLNTSLHGASLPPLAATVRRNYVYFTSLLQEPEAKWKRVCDTRGVTVTQLDSIDPTLVVYRAEATFVGLSVWDLFSTLSSPSLAKLWCPSMQGADLLQDLGGQSSVWHTRYAPSWPVMARDATLVQTSYKSPSSIHVFSFSADEHLVEPLALPAPTSSTIRMHVDLYGWSIEALSPTTVHVTLIEQSDPRGWLSKTRVPLQMITAMAGAGDYALRQGPPPCMTRLLNARAQKLEYDADTSTYHLEYGVARDGSAEPVTHTECVLWCNMEVWSPNIDVRVTPAPASVSCLRRHRLAGGGGLWLTIEHLADDVQREAVSIVVRKGPSQSTERGVVLLNGMRVRVDTEGLNPAQLHALAHKKRSKPRRVPLDWMYQGLSPKSKSAAATLSNDTATAAHADALSDADTSADADSVLASRRARAGHMPSDIPERVPIDTDGVETPDTEFKPEASEHGIDLVPKAGEGSARNSDVKSKMTRSASSSASQSRSRSQSQSQAPTDSVAETKEGPELTVPAMHAALQALTLLRHIHSERHPNPAGPQANWSFVSEKHGLYIHRRMIESVSAKVMVYRTDKIIQGVAADELLPLVTYPSVRCAWDENWASSRLLESFGSGASTSLWTSKGSFPFSPRMFIVSSMSAHSSGSGGRSDDATSIDTSSTMTHQPVYFHASASSDASRWDLKALLPASLPTGTVLLDGWIFENVDPYSMEQYAIPSTRCIHVMAIDYGGVPSGINTLWNASLAQAVLQLERCIKSYGPLPSVRTPPRCLFVCGDGRQDDQDHVWVLRRSRRASTLIMSDFDRTSRTWQVLLYVRNTSSSIVAGTGDKNQLINTPALDNRYTDISTAAASVTTPSTVSSLPATATATYTPHRPVSPSTQRLSSRSSAFFPKRTSSKEPTPIADVQVELQHYPLGYAVQILWCETSDTCDLTTRPDKVPNESLPVEVQIFDVPPSALQAATHAPDERSHRHCVRVTLPSSAPEHARMKSALVCLVISPLGSHGQNVSSTPALRTPAMTSSTAAAAAAPAPASSSTAVSPMTSPHVPVTVNGRVAEIIYGHEAARDALDVDEDQLEYIRRDESVVSRSGCMHDVGQSVFSVPVASITAQPPATKPVDAVPAPKVEADISPSYNELTEIPSPQSGANTSSLFGIFRPQYRNRIYDGFVSLVTGQQKNQTTTSNSSSTSAKSSDQTSKMHGQQRKQQQQQQDQQQHQHQQQQLGSSSLSGLQASERTARQQARRFRLSTLILFVIISFLLGSLTRAFVQPADYVLVPYTSDRQVPAAPHRPVTDASNEGSSSESVRVIDLAAREIDNFVRAARQLHTFARFGSTETVPSESATQSDSMPDYTGLVQWREMHKFLDIYLPGLPWRLVVGLAGV